jgi:hypothetical protein
MSARADAEPFDMDSRGCSDSDLAAPMRLLAAGIPLSLLLDLVSPFGPDSERIAATEKPPGASPNR